MKLKDLKTSRAIMSECLLQTFVEGDRGFDRIIVKHVDENSASKQSMNGKQTLYIINRKNEDKEGATFIGYENRIGDLYISKFKVDKFFDKEMNLIIAFFSAESWYDLQHILDRNRFYFEAPSYKNGENTAIFHYLYSMIKRRIRKELNLR